MATTWAAELKKDTTFTKLPNKALFDVNFDIILRQHVCFDGNPTEEHFLLTYHHHQHRIQILAHMMGWYAMLRGGIEISQLMWSNISFGKYTDGTPFPGLTYVKINFPEGWENMRVSMNIPVIDVHSTYVTVRDDPNDRLSFVKFVKFHRSKCQPCQDCFFCSE